MKVLIVLSAIVAVSLAQERWCPQPPFIENGYVVPGGDNIGESRRIICNSGYAIDGNDEIRCQADLRWSWPGRCVPAGGPSFPVPGVSGCGQAPFVEHGRIDFGSSNVGATRRIVCDSGYVVREEADVFCQSSGRWYISGYCEAETCGPVPFIPDGSATSGCSSVACKRLIRCNPGFRREGKCKLYCMSNGEWQIDGRCVRDVSYAQGCSEPFISNGFVEPGTNNFNDRRRVTCNRGYVISGRTQYITCQPNGEWAIPVSCRPF